jgi:lipopolysaccharide transport system ATP-binding protein
VGTGFHPELTGRENIFFNGSLLGMKKREIQSRFDAIVDFSGTEMFLDTPLKHYSSGMQLRLAFSVAAFLEPEILIIDEVLAVGDAEFQKKCLGKMEDVSKSGRTILFVSHNISSLKYLCTRGILLDKGKKSFDGPIDESIRRYLNIGNNEKSTDRLADPSLHHGTGEIFVDRIEVKTTSGPRIAHTGDTVHFCLSYEIRNKDFDFTACHVGIIIYDQNQNVLISHTNKLIGVHFSNRDFTSGNCIVFSIENLPLMKGPYSLSYNIVDQNKYLDSMENAFEFEVEEGLVYNYTMMNAGGILAVKGNWGIQKV